MPYNGSAHNLQTSHGADRSRYSDRSQSARAALDAKRQEAAEPCSQLGKLSVRFRGLLCGGRLARFVLYGRPEESLSASIRRRRKNSPWACSLATDNSSTNHFVHAGIAWPPTFRSFLPSGDLQ